MIPLSHAITERLKTIDPDNAQTYQFNGMKFRAHWRKNSMNGMKSRAIKREASGGISCDLSLFVRLAWHGANC